MYCWFKIEIYLASLVFIFYIIDFMLLDIVIFINLTQNSCHTL